MLTSQRGLRHHFDILVIGGGAAGLSYILNLHALRPNAKIALLSKTTLTESNSYWAQGGIAAVASQQDSIAKHVADTLRAGDGFCQTNVVQTILNAAPQAIKNLQQWGVEFAQVEGRAELGKEGGHSERRIYHAGDRTGQAITSTLLSRVKELPQVKFFERHMVVNLITQHEHHIPASQGEVAGAYVLEEDSGLIHTFLAKVVVLATGGAGKIYRYTTNPEVATGDGIAMAYRAGARVGNMEFYQFHPTLLYHHQINNFLISEALRGEGAYLRAPGSGERFMQRYAPDQMELATRDIVARAIFSEIEQNTYDYVYLDIRHHSKEFLAQRFPAIYQTLLQVGIDISKDLIPVVPAAHYLCGGVLTDVKGHTDLRRLFAIGETAFTGLHGANRLASNSLLECVVMGDLCAQATQTLIDQPMTYSNITDWDSQGVTDPRRASQINAHWRSIRGEMTSYAGIIRTEAGLHDLMRLIKTRSQAIEGYYWKHIITKDLIELRNIILVAELIVRGALSRLESRGAHYREDYPHKIEKSREILLRSHEEIRIRAETSDA